jgi:hypothetical protein
MTFLCLIPLDRWSKSIYDATGDRIPREVAMLATVVLTSIGPPAIPVTEG